MGFLQTKKEKAIELLRGLLDDFKYYIADQEEPPQRAGYITEVEQFLKEIDNETSNNNSTCN